MSKFVRKWPPRLWPVAITNIRVYPFNILFNLGNLNVHLLIHPIFEKYSEILYIACWQKPVPNDQQFVSSGRWWPVTRHIHLYSKSNHCLLSFICIFGKSLFVLFSFDHCVVCSDQPIRHRSTLHHIFTYMTYWLLTCSRHEHNNMTVQLNNNRSINEEFTLQFSLYLYSVLKYKVYAYEVYKLW